MGIRFTGSQGQYERIRRRQSLQQRENQVERESPERLDGAERKQTRWCRFGVWLRDWSREVWSGAKIIVQWAVGLFVVGFIAALVVNGYQSLDNSGWIVHNHDTPVWIEGDWMVGEYRECEMMTTTPPPGVAQSPEVRAELPRLFCGKRDEHGALSVTAFVHEFLNDPQGLTDAGDALGSGGDWSEFDSKFHVLPVDYHGRIDRPDEPFVSWRCQRLSGSLECKALN